LNDQISEREALPLLSEIYANPALYRSLNQPSSAMPINSGRVCQSCCLPENRVEYFGMEVSRDIPIKKSLFPDFLFS
jgi:hypothetical protein